MNSFAGRLAAKVPDLCLLARFVFAAVLLVYFWASGLSKLGAGLPELFHPSAGAYVQIFPKQMEAFGYDPSQFGLFHYLVVLMGVLSEFLIPLMITIGLLTRYAALGMIAFIAVQTATDLFGHGVLEDPTTLGKWFDRSSSSVIMDQRLLWLFVLFFLVRHGGGVLSLDQWLSSRKV
ncbi:DoxX family protein [Paracoccaceae bacterium]|nr:DoxX family protein [Paracoccaceae bacterium]